MVMLEIWCDGDIGEPFSSSTVVRLAAVRPPSLLCRRTIRPVSVPLPALALPTMRDEHVARVRLDRDAGEAELECVARSEVQQVRGEGAHLAGPA